MAKDFDGWNKNKKKIDQRSEAPFCHERQIWWCTLGVNVGFEQDGSDKEYRRPVLVLRILSARTFVAIPLTTSTSRHPLRPSVGKVAGQNAHALLSQMRVMDTKRLVSKIGYLDKNMFKSMRKAVKDML